MKNSSIYRYFVKLSAVALMFATIVIGFRLPRVQAQPAKTKKPNIVIIWGDDIGQSNISAYTLGLMGYKTPNIDRIAKEGRDDVH
jgi:hypothetical protein